MSASPRRIAVLASLGRNPVNGAARPNREDVLALEIGRHLGGEISLLHAGAAAVDAVKDFLAYGGAEAGHRSLGRGRRCSGNAGAGARRP